MQLFDGKSIAADLLARLQAAASKLPKPPQLGVVLIGDDPASIRYVAKKQQAAERVGIILTVHHRPANSTEGEVVQLLKQIQTSQTLDGLIIQLPLPDTFDTDRILDLVNPLIDVDCLTYTNLSLLPTTSPRFIPPTPAAILELLQRITINLTLQNIVLVGNGRLVGQPLAAILQARNCHVTVCDSQTPDLGEVTAQADVLITAVGKAGLITGDMIKDGAVVLDAGCEVIDGKLYGDVNPASAAAHAAWFTPTPGGVGPLTVVKLLENVVIGYKRQDT